MANVGHPWLPKFVAYGNQNEGLVNCGRPDGSSDLPGLFMDPPLFNLEFSITGGNQMSCMSLLFVTFCRIFTNSRLKWRDF